MLIPAVFGVTSGDRTAVVTAAIQLTIHYACDSETDGWRLQPWQVLFVRLARWIGDSMEWPVHEHEQVDVLEVMSKTSCFAMRSATWGRKPRWCYFCCSGPNWYCPLEAGCSSPPHLRGVPPPARAAATAATLELQDASIRVNAEEDLVVEAQTGSDSSTSTTDSAQKSLVDLI